MAAHARAINTISAIVAWLAVKATTVAVAIAASHFVYLSQPEAVASLIAQAAAGAAQR